MALASTGGASARFGRGLVRVPAASAATLSLAGLVILSARRRASSARP